MVFKGVKPGVYDNWDDARLQVENFPGALYKSYPSSAEASEAFRKGTGTDDLTELRNLVMGAVENRKSGPPSHASASPIEIHPEIDGDAWAVDASCLGNPGIMEYRGVEVKTGKVIFTVGPFEDATNNIGEFLAIVHAMALMTKQGNWHNIYSDSKTGMAWVRNRMVKTQLKPTEKNKKVFELMARAVAWLQTHHFPAKVMKWETEKWGEIPADFGRK